MERKNQVLMTVLGVFALVIVTVGVSFAFFTYTRTGTTSSNIKTGGEMASGKITFVYTESNDDVTLSNAFPTTVETGKKLTNTYDFTIAGNITGAKTSTALGYDIIAVNNTKATTTEVEALTNNRVRAYLTELTGGSQETDMLTDTDDHTVLMSDVFKDNAVEGVLYSGIMNFDNNNAIEQNQSKKYRLRIWLDYENNDDIGVDVHADDNGTGTITSGEGYTVTSSEDEKNGKEVTVTNANGETKTYTYSLKIKVAARQISNDDQQKVTRTSGTE